MTSAAKKIDTTSAESEIRSKVDAWVKCVKDKDVETVMKLYADDVHAYDALPPLQFIGKPAYKAHWEKCMEMCPNSHPTVEVDDLHVAISGDMGLSFGLFKMGGTDEKGEEQSCWMRISQVWCKGSGNWLIRHEHCSMPVDMESGKAVFDAQP